MSAVIATGVFVALAVTGMVTAFIPTNTPHSDHENRIGAAVVAGVACGALAAGAVAGWYA